MKKVVKTVFNNSYWLWCLSPDWIVVVQSADHDRGIRSSLLRSEASKSEAFRALLLASLPSDSGIYC